MADGAPSDCGGADKLGEGVRLRSGETLASAVCAVLDVFHSTGPRDGGEEGIGQGAGRNFLDAILLNCSSPEVITAGIMELQKMRSRKVAVGGDQKACHAAWKIGGYPNAFKPNLQDGYVERSDELYAELALEWTTHLGAEVIGGCCGIFPEQIAAMKQGLGAGVWPRA